MLYRFASTDLYALMECYDEAEFLHPTHFRPQNIQPDMIETVKRNLIKRYLKTGLVDADGRPTQELAAMLEPVRRPKMAIVDGHHPSFEDPQIDRRKNALYFSDAGITLATKQRGLRMGYVIRSLTSHEAEIWLRGRLGFRPDVMVDYASPKKEHRSWGKYMAYGFDGTWKARSGFDAFYGLRHVQRGSMYLDGERVQVESYTQMISVCAHNIRSCSTQEILAVKNGCDLIGTIEEWLESMRLPTQIKEIEAIEELEAIKRT